MNFLRSIKSPCNGLLGTIFVVFIVGLGAWSDAEAQSKSKLPPPSTDKLLDRLTGSWKITRTKQGSPPTEQLGEARWIANHQYVALTVNPTDPSATYSSVMVIGFNPTRERYVAHLFDSYGAGAELIGYGHGDDRSITIVFACPSVTATYILTNDAVKNAWTVDITMADNGKFTSSARDVMVRP